MERVQHPGRLLDTSHYCQAWFLVCSHFIFSTLKVRIRSFLGASLPEKSSLRERTALECVLRSLKVNQGRLENFL